MSKARASLVDELVQATKILLHRQVLDGFGHVSVRDPDNADRFLLPTALPPILVTAKDVIEFNPDSSPVNPEHKSLYSERFLHGSIYQARPEVNAICHHHAPAILPFCVNAGALLAVTQTGAAMGALVPVWDSRDEFGDTNLLVNNAAQADALAKSLGDAWMILMRHHGACVLGQNLPELVFRAIYACQDASIQLNATLLGEIEPLNPGELELSGRLNPGSVRRCWEHWLAQSGVKDPS